MGHNQRINIFNTTILIVVMAIQYLTPVSTTTAQVYICHLCRDQTFPGKPKGYVVMLQEVVQLPKPMYSCEELYYLGLEGGITERDCLPMVATLMEHCQCGEFNLGPPVNVWTASNPTTGETNSWTVPWSYWDVPPPPPLSNPSPPSTPTLLLPGPLPPVPPPLVVPRPIPTPVQSPTNSWAWPTGMMPPPTAVVVTNGPWPTTTNGPNPSWMWPTTTTTSTTTLPPPPSPQQQPSISQFVTGSWSMVTAHWGMMRRRQLREKHDDS